jgi:hypothetical protein
MPVLQRILAEIGIERPDGCPLYALPMSEEKHAELGTSELAAIPRQP